MDLPRFKPFSIIATAVLASTACSSLPPAAQQYKTFAEYAEAVFRHQNQITSRIMMLSETDVFSENKQLQNAEQAMNDACHLLNEYAEHEMNGDSMSIFFKRRVQASIENCDDKIHTLEIMLVELDESSSPSNAID